jgi:Kef-type K+ transport system membrane component KefB
VDHEDDQQAGRHLSPNPHTTVDGARGRPGHEHPLFHPKLDAIGYGFLVPVFFVTSGLTFNLSVLFSSASTLLRVPLFLLALLVVRGLPAVLYRSALASIRDVAAVGLLQATSLPFIVAATTIGLQVHAIRPANAAALIAAGLFSVILSPSSLCSCCDRLPKARAWSPSRRTFAGRHARRSGRTRRVYSSAVRAAC